MFHKHSTAITAINSEQSILPKHNSSRVKTVKRQLFDISSSDEAGNWLF